MRKDLGIHSYVYPMPVLVISTYSEDNIPNAMVAAWGCISDSNKITLVLSKQHKTMKNILANKGFTVAIATEDYVAEVDYLGLSSGNFENKFDKLNFTLVKSKYVNAPIILEFPLSLECELFTFDEETDVLVGTIVSTNADTKILNHINQVDITKLRPISYNTFMHTYIGLGEEVGRAFNKGLKYK